MSKEALLSIERTVLVNGNVEHRRPFITNEEHCRNLVNSVPLEISRDVSETARIDAFFKDHLSKPSSHHNPAIWELPGHLFLTNHCFGLSYKSFEEAVQEAFSKLKSLIGRK